MSLQIGGPWCPRCKHYRENHPIICRKCLECEETPGSPTNYEPEVLTTTTVVWPDGVKYAGLDTTTHESWTFACTIGTNGANGKETP